VLERGFALVRGGALRHPRRAAAIKNGESLTLTFLDGDAKAVAGDGMKTPKKKRGVDQGSLF
jgi:exonuclease VII large subunit